MTLDAITLIDDGIMYIDEKRRHGKPLLSHTQTLYVILRQFDRAFKRSDHKISYKLVQSAALSHLSSRSKGPEDCVSLLNCQLRLLGQLIPRREHPMFARVQTVHG